MCINNREFFIKRTKWHIHPSERLARYSFTAIVSKLHKKKDNNSIKAMIWLILNNYDQKTHSLSHLNNHFWRAFLLLSLLLNFQKCKRIPKSPWKLNHKRCFQAYQWYIWHQLGFSSWWHNHEKNWHRWHYVYQIWLCWMSLSFWVCALLQKINVQFGLGIRYNRVCLQRWRRSKSIV